MLAYYWSIFMIKASDWLRTPEYNLSPSSAKEYTSTSRNINQQSKIYYRIIITSPSAWLAASLCLLAAGRSWPVSSTAAPVCWTEKRNCQGFWIWIWHPPSFSRMCIKRSRIYLVSENFLSSTFVNFTSVVSFFIFFLLALDSWASRSFLSRL